MRKYFIFISIILIALLSVGFLLLAQDSHDSVNYPDAREYAPNLWFDSQEKYYPADPMDFYYDENGEEFAGKVAVAEYDKLSMDEKMAKVKVFYKVDNIGGEFVYQYWLFYVMNNYENGHYGDWESVFVFVDKESGNINKAVGSAHGSGHKLEIKSEDTRHIWAYIGNGSHASCAVEIKGQVCGSNIWKSREDWDSNGKVISYSSFKFIALEQGYIDSFGKDKSFNRDKSPTLGFNPRKILRLESIPFNIPFFDEEKESYLNLPLIGKYFGQTPTFAWVKEEYRNPEEILVSTHTKIARNIGGFFNDTGSFLAAMSSAITSPIANLFTANIFNNRSKVTGSDPVTLGGVDIPTQQDILDGVGGDPAVNVSGSDALLGQIPGDTPIPTSIPTSTELIIEPIIVDPSVRIDEPETEVAFVTRIIDGDTVELASGQKLRYIGINTPETPNGCFANEATEKNSELILNKQIILLNGPTDIDRFGRLLRFVWQDTDLSGTLSDSDVFVNLALVEGGYAYAFDFGEPHAYSHRFETSEATARRGRLGLWGGVCNPNEEEVILSQPPQPIVRIYEPSSNVAQITTDNDTQPSSGDETSPSIPAISVVNNTFFNSSSDINSEEDGYQINLYGTAEASSTITIVQNQTYNATTTSEGNWSSEVNLINEGANNFSITAKDAAGNTSTSTLITLNLDSVSATSTISITNYSTNSNQFTVNWGTSASDLSYYEVEYRIGSGSAWQDWGNATTTDINKNYQNATSSTYYFRVRGTDTHQNIGEWKESSGIVINLPYSLVINEIQINNAEFVELYNSSSSTTSLSGYYFSYYSSSRSDWTNPYRNKVFPENASIPSNGYFLIGLKGYAISSGNPSTDWQPYTSAQLSNSAGAVAIFSFNPTTATTSQFAYDNRVDAIGWGSTSTIALYEQSPATTTPAVGESLTRNVNHTDTDNNSVDFTVATSTTPTNSAGETYVAPVPSSPVWAMYQNDARHSGLATLSGPAWTNSASTSLAWTFDMKKGQNFDGARSQPVIGSDGAVYVTSALGNIYAINPDGSKKWKFEPAKNNDGGDGDGWASASPALSADSSVVYSVYTDIDNNKLILYAIRASDKSLFWKYSVTGSNEGFTSPILDSSGNIYVASKSRLYSISSSGGLNSGWPFAPYNEYTNYALGINMPAISEEGGVEYIYINANMSNNIGDKYIFKLDTNGNEAIEKGQLSDAKSLSNGISISLTDVLYTGGYVSYNTSGLYALDPSDLSEIWYTPLGANIAGPIPSFDTEGNIYIGTSGLLSSGAFYKLNATGTILWTFTGANPGENQYPVVVDSQGRIYVGAKDNYIYVLNPSDGTVIWKYLLSSSEPQFYPVGFAIGDGAIYAVGYDGRVYAF